MVRNVIIGTNVFIQDLGNIGVCESFTPPSLKNKRLTHTTPAGDTSISYGAFESLDTTTKLKKLPKAIFEAIANLDGAEVIHKAAIKDGSDTNNYMWVCTGSIDLEYGEFKDGEFIDVTITQKGLRKYVHEINNSVKAKIDHDNLIVQINGQDLLADARQILNA